MAQLVISAAGAAAGFLIGGPTGAQIGWVAGSALGSVIAPQRQRIEGPRLADLKVTGSAYGAPIPYVEGHPRVAGQIVWASDKYPVTSTTTSGGKGGPSVETVNTIYKVDVLLLLSANTIAGVRRIWSNGALVWTKADTASAESIAASDASAHWDAITVYGGGASQLPDPIYEAAVGTANAPAYRGRGTVMIEGLNLGASGQLPNLTFELAQDGDSVISAGFTEEFEDGFTPYTLGGGHYVDWEFVSTPWGDGISAVGGATTATSSTLYRDFDAIDIDRVSFYFKIGADAPALPHEDSGAIWVKLASVMILAFIPRRETTFDASERAHINVKGGSLVAIGSTAVPTGVWYELIWTLDSSTQYTVTIREQASGAVLATQTGSCSIAGGPPTSVDRLQFTTEGPVTTYYKPEVTFDRVILGTGGDSIGLVDAPLDEVVERQCVRGGLDPAQVDVTDLAPYSVRSLAVANVTPPRSVIELLALAYHFEAVESLGVLKFVLRGGASAATIPYASMGATQGQAAEPLPLRLANDVETPAQIIVRHVNVSADYQDGSESSDRLLGASRAVQTIEVPIGLTPTEARQLADVHVMDVAASQRTFGPVALSNDYAHLEPTDVVTLTDVEGQTYRARILRMTSAGAGLHTIEGVVEDATILDSDIATTTGGYTDSDTVSAPADTVLELLDIPLLRDVDDGPGLYLAVKGAGTPWPGCAVYDSADGVTYAQRLQLAEATQIGTCSTTLGAWSGGARFDETNSVTVDVGSTATLQSWSRDEILAGTATAYLIGDELIYARTATAQSAGVYKLTGLLRGRRGTEWATGLHGASERCVAIPASGTGLRRLALATAQIGVERHYKAGTYNLPLADAADEAFTCAGVSQMCFAPVDLRTADDGVDRSVTWQRRTRGSARFAGSAGISVPLFETDERYQVDFYDTGPALVSSEVVTEPAWSTATGSFTGYTVTVRQLGAVGAGYAASITL